MPYQEQTFEWHKRLSEENNENCWKCGELTAVRHDIDSTGVAYGYRNSNTNFGHKFNPRELCMKKVPKTEWRSKIGKKGSYFETLRNKASNHGVENPCISETKVGLSVEMQNGFLWCQTYDHRWVCTTKSDSGPANPHTSLHGILRNDLEKGPDWLACALRECTGIHSNFGVPVFSS